jgi:hypothetical protein
MKKLIDWDTLRRDYPDSLMSWDLLEQWFQLHPDQHEVLLRQLMADIPNLSHQGPERVRLVSAIVKMLERQVLTGYWRVRLRDGSWLPDDYKEPGDVPTEQPGPDGHPVPIPLDDLYTVLKW